MRHRVSIQDFSLLGAILLVGFYLALDADIFFNERQATQHEQKIETGEALALGGLLSVGLLFVAGRYREQKNEIQRRIAAEQYARTLAFQDLLTGLPNRRQFDDAFRAATTTPAVFLPDLISVIVLDLDGFKEVNDTLGHCFGDALLKQVAGRLLRCVRPTDMVARVGGDEFALFLPQIADVPAAAAVADGVLRSFSEPFLIEGQTVSVGASVGVATSPLLNSAHTQDLLSNADLALCQAKAEGKQCRRMFTQSLREAALHKRAYAGELQQAYDASEFELFYQPQVRLSDRALVGAEALLRWRHPARGLLGPADFMPALESGLLAAQVGDWIIQQACAQAARWRTRSCADFRMGVNLFGAQFRTGDLAERVRAILASERLPPSALELEITENIILRHDEAMLGPLRRLYHDGVGIAFDDYGTGYASLSMLKRYPLTRLKIDQSFVREICASREDAAIVRAILHLGQGFDLAVIAEGVETDEQQAWLRQKGCQEAQGYLFGKPMSVSEFETCFWPKETIATLDLNNLEAAINSPSFGVTFNHLLSPHNELLQSP